MSTGGVGELNAQGGQRQGFAASVVRHDEMMALFTVSSNGTCFVLGYVCVAAMRLWQVGDVGGSGRVCFAGSKEGAKNAKVRRWGMIGGGHGKGGIMECRLQENGSRWGKVQRGEG